jgi:hypothetical protein
MAAAQALDHRAINGLGSRLGRSAMALIVRIN